MRHATITPFGKFLLGFWGMLILSLLWSIPLYILGGADGSCRLYTINWLKNHLTYGLTHHLFFPVAVGLFLASVRLDIIRKTGLVSRFCLVILLVLGTLVTIEDSTGDRRYQPYELPDACQWLCAETRLRTESHPDTIQFDKIASCFSPSRVKQVSPTGSAVKYFNSMRMRSTLAEISVSTNWIAKTAILLTWLLILMGAALLWYSGVTALAGQMDDVMRLRLSAVLLFLSPWVPARIYVNWYQHEYVGLKSSQITPLVAAVIILGIFSFLLFMAVLKSRVKREAVVDILGIMVPVCGFLLVKYAPLLGEINKALNAISLLLIITVCFALGFLLVIAGRLALLSELPKVPNPEPQAVE